MSRKTGDRCHGTGDSRYKIGTGNCSPIAGFSTTLHGQSRTTSYEPHAMKKELQKTYTGLAID